MKLLKSNSLRTLDINQESKTLDFTFLNDLVGNRVIAAKARLNKHCVQHIAIQRKTAQMFTFFIYMKKKFAYVTKNALVHFIEQNVYTIKIRLKADSNV